MLRKYNKTAYFVLFREFHKWFSPPFDKFAVNLNSRIDNIDYEHCHCFLTYEWILRRDINYFYTNTMIFSIIKRDIT